MQHDAPLSVEVVSDTLSLGVAVGGANGSASQVGAQVVTCRPCGGARGDDNVVVQALEHHFEIGPGQCSSCIGHSVGSQGEGWWQHTPGVSGIGTGSGPIELMRVTFFTEVRILSVLVRFIRLTSAFRSLCT